MNRIRVLLALLLVPLAEMTALEESAPADLTAAVREKHRLWYRAGGDAG
ncbi:MAG: hypothetical protein ACKV19_19135 [Verrucomicrobiales bacterium]